MVWRPDNGSVRLWLYQAPTCGAFGGPPHQIQHLGSPWFTRYLAAPAGTQLGLHVLMPLEGLVMTPVTITFGRSASYNLLSAVMPGLLSCAAYRVARLWLPSQAGALAAGGFFGLSSMLTWRAWYHLNLATERSFCHWH